MIFVNIDNCKYKTQKQSGKRYVGTRVRAPNESGQAFCFWSFDWIIPLSMMGFQLGDPIGSIHSATHRG